MVLGSPESDLSLYWSYARLNCKGPWLHTIDGGFACASCFYGSFLLPSVGGWAEMMDTYADMCFFLGFRGFRGAYIKTNPLLFIRLWMDVVKRCYGLFEECRNFINTLHDLDVDYRWLMQRKWDFVRFMVIKAWGVLVIQELISISKFSSPLLNKRRPYCYI